MGDKYISNVKLSAIIMRFIRKLEEDEQAQLHRMTQQEVGRVAERAHIILLSARGFAVPKITDIFTISEDTVYKWFNRFEAEGPEGLFDQERCGRPRQIDKAGEAQLRRLLERSPLDEGYEFTTWTVPLLRSHLAKHVGIDVSVDTVRRTLRRLNFVWRRPRWYVDSGDPAYAQQMDAIERAIFADEQRIILVEDETNVRRLPPLRAMWMPRGQQTRVKVPSGNDKFTFYGVLDLSAGTTFTASYPKGNSGYTTKFLESLLKRFPGRLLLIWDQARWHTSKAVKTFLADCDRLQVLLFPKRAPQENPMEDLWRHLKRVIAANLERSLPVLKQACQKFFNGLSNKKALKMAGLPA
jgi:transposase